MPRYFFHVRDGASVQSDGNGLELPDVDAARKEAVRRAYAIWSANPPDPDHNGQVFEIADDTGVTVLEVPFSEAFAERAVT
jgi:hypothetical protein